MSDGTGTDPSTGRCPDCGHLYERDCGCSCCAMFVCAECGRPPGMGHAMFCAGQAGMVADDGV